MSKPIRQDYIAKVRYTNNLPPPPLNPKFLNYRVDDSKQEGIDLLTSLFRKENFNQLINNIDDEYGMNLNLINNRGFLSNDDDLTIGQLKVNTETGNKSNSASVGNNIFNGKSNVPSAESGHTIKLHPKDRELLRDANISTISKSEPGVSFLRRTEYIAEKATEKKSEKIGTNNETITLELVDADSQLKSVESTFTNAQNSLSNFSSLRHPKKKHLKPINAWPLLPDTSLMDVKFLNMKFLGSASINREFLKNGSDQINRDLLTTSIFKPITSEDGEWLSLFQLKDLNKINELKKKLNSTEKEQPINLLDEDDDNQEVFNYKHTKNYDMKFSKFTKPNEELVIKLILNPNKKRKFGYYSPINGRLDLKKFRLSTNTEVQKFLKDSSIDQINLKLREPTTNELKKMDAARADYDPMEYDADDVDEDQDDEEQDIGAEFNAAAEKESD